MGGSFSSAMTSYSQLAKSLLSSNSFNSTTSLPAVQPQLPVRAAAEPADITGETVPGPTLETQLVNLPTTKNGTTTTIEDHPAHDELTRITDLVQPRSLAIAAGSFTLLANPPRQPPNLLGLHKIYLLFLLLSFVLSTGSLFFILKSRPSPGVVWLQKKAMKIAISSIVIAVTVRIFSGLSNPISWYDVLVPVLIVGGVSLYLLLGWIVANKSTQTARSSQSTTAYTSEV